LIEPAVPPPSGRPVRHAISEFFHLVAAWFDGTRSPYRELIDAKSDVHRWRTAYGQAVVEVAELVTEHESVTQERDAAIEQSERAIEMSVRLECENHELRQQLGAS
jgi:hypothetical protein